MYIYIYIYTHVHIHIMSNPHAIDITSMKRTVKSFQSSDVSPKESMRCDAVMNLPPLDATKAAAASGETRRGFGGSGGPMHPVVGEVEK